MQHHNQNYLTKLNQTPRIQSILQHNPALTASLEENSSEVRAQIQRYKEWRADTQALQAMQCPYCIEENMAVTVDEGTYNPRGYLNKWQYQSKIKQLKQQGCLCQHHLDNGFNIDTSITDGSTLEQRLKIIRRS